jgi:translation initiation factor 1
MSKKKRSNNNGLVYSTNADWQQEEEEEVQGPLPSEQTLYVRFETKHRGGKTVTVVYDFEGNDTEGKELTKILKQKCGTGGSFKAGEIVIQGKVVDKVRNELVKLGYKVKG